MKLTLSGIALALGLLGATNTAQAAGLTFKSTPSSLTRGTIQRMFVRPAAGGTTSLDLVVGASITSNIVCTITGLAYADALRIVEMIDTGVIITVTCNSAVVDARTTVVTAGSYYLTAGS